MFSVCHRDMFSVFLYRCLPAQSFSLDHAPLSLCNRPYHRVRAPPYRKGPWDQGTNKETWPIRQKKINWASLAPTLTTPPGLNSRPRTTRTLTQPPGQGPGQTPGSCSVLPTYSPSHLGTAPTPPVPDRGLGQGRAGAVPRGRG